MTPEFPIPIAINVYTALINQTGTAAPTATILHNTLGTIVWTREGPGHYLGTLTGQFPTAKTAIFTQGQSSPAFITAGVNTSPNDIYLIQKNDVGTNIDNIENLSIEIRTYN